MAFIIAVIGGVILLFKYMSDSAANTTYRTNFNRSMSMTKTRFQEWKDQVEDRALEEDLHDYIFSPEHREEVSNTIKEAYQNIPSLKDFEFNDCFLAPGLREQCLDIMLAKNGKVRSSFIWMDSIVCSLAPGYGKRTRKEWDEKFEFWVYIMNELKKSVTDARLLFITFDENKSTHIAYDVCDVDEFRYRSGTLSWIHSSYYNDNLEYT